MQIQNSITVIATIIMLGFSTFSSAFVIHGPPAPDQDSVTFTPSPDSSSDSDVSCNLCQNNFDLRPITVLVGGKELYMFVDIHSNNNCCNVIANSTWYLTDIRGKTKLHQ